MSCLEQQFSINMMTIQSIVELERRDVPSLCSILLRGFLLSKILGLLGLIAGTATAKRKNIYIMQITFASGGIGIAEVDDRIYEALLEVMVKAQINQRTNNV